MRELLDLIWPTHGFGELRTFSYDTTPDNVGLPHPEQHFVDLAHGGVDEAVRLAALFDALERDVYYGVLPRMRLSGKAIDTWPETTVLWADVDGKRFEDGKRGAIDAVLGFDIPASVIVDSGHGAHAYWKLDAAVSFPLAQLAMKGIAKAVRGDAVYDAPRVLRIPGTRNHKLMEQPEDVRLLKLDTTRTLRFSDFSEAMDAGTPTEPEGWTIQQQEPTSLDGWPKWLAGLIQNGASVGTRSERSYAAVCGLLKQGLGDADIFTVFQNSAIGEKMRQKGAERGAHWLQRTIDNARRDLRP